MQGAFKGLAKALTLILLTQFSTAWATDSDDPVVQIGDPTYQGSGCPD
jgi:hypothetical protein